MGDNLHPYVTEEDETSFGDTVLIEETVVWDNNEDVDSASNFVVENDPVNLKTEVVDVNQSFMSADEEFDQTRYFSILDSSVNESVLPDIPGLSLDTAKSDNVTDDMHVNHYINEDQNESLQLVMDGTDVLEPDLSLNNALIINDEVYLYKMEGTDDIYAIQTADDGNGNLQRYQFKVRINDLGQYEAIPGTIEIQSEDSPLAQALSQVNSGDRTMVQEPLTPSINIKQEKSPSISPPLPDEYIDDHAEESSDFLVVNEDEIGAESEAEHYEEIYVTENIIETNEETVPTLRERLPNRTISEEKATVSEEDLNERNTLENLDMNEDQNHFATENFMKETEGVNDEQVEYLEEAYQETDFEEEYHTVEGHHITGDSEEDMEYNEYCASANFHQDTEHDEVAEELMKLDESANRESGNKMKYELQQTGNHGVQMFNKKENVSYYILKSQMGAPNTANISSNSYNPRSLLKKTFAAHQAVQQIQHEIDSEQEELPHISVFPSVKVNNVPKANILNKINKSVVIPPPMRSHTRQPRKQAITPIERIGSEIIVQEVTFAGNNILTSGNFLFPKKRLNPNEIYQISDSDEDYTPQKAKMPNKHRKYKRKSKFIEITISDSEDNTDESVIEIPLSDDDGDYDINKENIVGSNRKRKNQHRLSEDAKIPSQETNITSEYDTEESIVASPPKRKRGRPPKVPKPIGTSVQSSPEDTSRKIVNSCKNKSLSTDKQNESSSESCSLTDSTDIVEKAFKCNDCTESFKTKFLLVKHEESHQNKPEKTTSVPTKYKCNLCDKSFSSNILLNAHKKIHIKSKLTKSTCPYKVSPRKILEQRKKIQSVFKTPNLKSQCLKCDECGKAYSTLSTLESHKKVHLLYPCVNCKLSFNSKLLLNSHVRQNCVKAPRNLRTRLSFSQPPAASSNKRVSSGPNLLKTPALTCPLCQETFKTHTTLYRHRRIVHENCAPVELSSKKKSSKKHAIKDSGVPLLLKCHKNLDSKFSKAEKTS